MRQLAHVAFEEIDVSELAQAKGANVAGLQVVFDQYGLQFDDVAVFYLAGGFGRHLKKEASKRIGVRLLSATGNWVNCCGTMLRTYRVGLRRSP